MLCEPALPAGFFNKINAGSLRGQVYGRIMARTLTLQAGIPMFRTRFAPSPTGYMHIGNLRTALYAYLLAKKHAGVFILRIEDTDQSRNVPAALAAIYNGLALAGISYDEGPDKDGGKGPYVQSQRLPIYQKYADELVTKGAAYYCFCQKDDKTTGIQQR